MEYRHKTSPSPRKFKVVASARNVLFTVFLDMEGVVPMKFLEQGETVNSERYISILRALKLKLRRVPRDKNSIPQHDNAARTSVAKPRTQLEVRTLPHLACSPDFAPSDYFCFHNSKSTRRTITVTNMRKLSQMFADGAVESRLNSLLTSCAN
ncbi:histone-lysine N-methyltransferase SETMAR [Elysia marginata]|uniref:Histone-lysine N-methyltransferase SETMAR n=1 Tax=Elysia marginata TaxID=1093978 RepID=A0AAV4HSL6_9GAST|nr:histone-lysine N-methyltransferase SETMAR [Elysia marginata]